MTARAAAATPSANNAAPRAKNHPRYWAKSWEN